MSPSEKRSQALPGITYGYEHGKCGKCYITVNYDPVTKYPKELFISFGKSGSCFKATLEANGRMISHYLREAKEEAPSVAKQLIREYKGYHCHGEDSCVTFIGDALENFLTEMNMVPDSIPKSERPETLKADSFMVETGCGSMFVFVTHDSEKNPKEIFCKLGKETGCPSITLSTASRTASRFLRYAKDPVDAAKTIGKELKGVKCNQCSCCVDALGNALEKFINENHNQKTEE